MPPGVVFRGGPVSPDAVIGLARAATPETAWAAPWRVVIDSVGTVDLSVPPEDQPVGLGGARLFSGYSGWAPDQLEAELAEGAWFVLEALAADVFCADADRLWHDVMRRQGGTLSSARRLSLAPLAQLTVVGRPVAPGARGAPVRWPQWR